MSTLVIRADASPRIGAGHVMRCLALAQGWRDRGGESVLVSRSLPDALARRFQREGCRTVDIADVPDARDASRLGELAGACRADWVVLDGYHLGAVHHDAARRSGARVLAVDDYAHAGRYAVDLVVNPNLHARADLYHGDGAEALCGPRYALLRREFLGYASFVRTVPPVASRLLVTLGGSDVGGFAAVLDAALADPALAGLSVTIVRGQGQPHLGRPTGRIEVLDGQDDMAVPMRAADMALASAGGTTWELAFMQVPSVLVTLADNQRPVAEHAAREGSARSLGAAAQVQPNLLATALRELGSSRRERDAQARAGRRLIDGGGVDRVMMRMLGVPIRLRAATPDDSRQVWEWANAPATRAASFHPAAIPWEVHVRWFAAKLGDPRTRYFIAVDAADRDVGQVRIDAIDDERVMSIAVDPSAQGRGYGARIIAEACRATADRVVFAYIKPDNDRSLRAFARAGFGRAGETRINGQAAVRLEWRRQA